MKGIAVKTLVDAYRSAGWLSLVLNISTVWLMLGASLLLVRTGSSFGAPVPGGLQEAP